MNITILEDSLLIENTLSYTELEYLKNNCNNFINDTKIGKELNFYNRQKVNDDNLTEYKSKLKTVLKEYYANTEYNFTDSWINKIDSTQPVVEEKDKFHLDEDNLSIVTFINDDYIGGEFSYLNKKNEEVFIQPKQNLTIILNGSEIKHRVCEVISGERFTLISFLEYEIKKNKTLL
jgi:predicted 2-oxoglutarate/Fe(II)-dependent dioxygenase YbiX